LNASFSTAASPVPTDPVTLRASLYPEEAALARRLLARAREIQAEYGFTPAEVAAAATRRMPSPKALALIELACSEADVLAGALWGGNARPGRTLGEIATILRGGVAGPPPDEHALDAALGGAAFEVICEKIETVIDRCETFSASVADLRVALDPWAWEIGYETVGELYASLRKRAAAYVTATNLMQGHATFEEALLCTPLNNPTEALESLRRLNPTIDRRKAEAAFRRSALREEGRADAMAPFMATFSGTRLIDVERADDMAASATDGLARLGELHAVNHAAQRLRVLLADLANVLPPAALDVIQGRPLDDVRASVSSAREGSDRMRASREMAGVRSAFSRTGFGDVMNPGDDFEGRVLGAVNLDDTQRREPEAAGTLDLLLPEVGGREGGSRPWTSLVTRWRPAQESLSTGRRYDVVVVDDAASLGESETAALRDLSSVVHLVGSERGSGIELPIPHRSLDSTLANLGRPSPERGWAGAPAGAGVVVRILPDDASVEDALTSALAAVRETGLRAIDAKEGQGTSDVVVLAMESVAGSDIVAAGARARSAVLVLARECSWSPPKVTAEAVPYDEGLLASYGWRLVADAWDGRVYANGDRSVIVTDEPDGYDHIGENVVQRVARLSAAGWAPIVSWRGSPRARGEMLRLVERNAVPNGSHIGMELATFPLPRSVAPPAALRGPSMPARPPEAHAAPATPASLRFEDVPASPHRAGTFHDVVWKLKWIREEVLIPFNADPTACLLTDDRIVGLVRLGIDDEAVWQAKFRGPMLRGADARQLVVRDVVMDIVALLPRTRVAVHTKPMVEGVAYDPGAIANRFGRTDGQGRLGGTNQRSDDAESVVAAKRM
jgi:hypothetical protein